ncbi:hypothetical protein IAT40_006794 [Kwoniella sp. CBS 6097]
MSDPTPLPQSQDLVIKTEKDETTAEPPAETTKAQNAQGEGKQAENGTLLDKVKVEEVSAGANETPLNQNTNTTAEAQAGEKQGEGREQVPAKEEGGAGEGENVPKKRGFIGPYQYQCEYITELHRLANAHAT